MPKSYFKFSVLSIIIVVAGCAKKRNQEQTLVAPFATNKIQIKRDNNSQFISTDEIDLQVIVNNACVRELKNEQRNDFLGDSLRLDFKKMIDIPVQSYQLLINGQIDEEEIKKYANKEKCVIGITNDEDIVLAPQELQFSNVDDVQANGLETYIHPEYMKVQAAKDKHFSSVLNKGKPVLLSIIDSGIFTGHNDIKGVNYKNASENGDFTGDGDPEDLSGHGSHVAGLAASVLDFNPNAIQLMSAKVLNHRGRGKASSVFNGIIYSVHKGADIINLSLGSGSDKSYSMYAEAIGYAVRNNVLMVIAAGNDYRRVGSPYDSVTENPSGYEGPWPAAFASVKGVISVGSIDISTQLKSDFSNHGPNVDIWAAGCDSIHRRGMPSLSIRSASSYSYRCGTSMASPVLAGVAALIIKHFKAKGKGVSASVVEDILTSTVADADKNNGYNGQVNLNNIAIKLKFNQAPKGPDFIIKDAYDQYISDLYATFLLRPHLTEEVRILSEIFKKEKKSFEWLLKKALSEYPKLNQSCNRVVKPLFYAATRKSVVKDQKLDMICEAYESGSISNDQLVSILVASEGFLDHIESIGLQNHPVGSLEEGIIINNQEFSLRKKLDSAVRKHLNRPALSSDFAIVKDQPLDADVDGLVQNSNERFILNTYSDVLYRAKNRLFFEDLAGWNYWSTNLNEKKLTREQVINFMLSSKEKWVREVFKEFSHQQPPKSTVDTFIASLTNGSKTKDQIREEIRNYTPTEILQDPLTQSEIRKIIANIYDEELHVVADYTESNNIAADISQYNTYVDQQRALSELRINLRNSNRGQILAVFLEVLRRSPNHKEKTKYLAKLEAGSSLNDIRLELDKLRYLEEGIVINDNNEIAKAEIIKIYKDALGRLPQSSGLNYWLSMFTKGLTIKEIKGHIENSEEARVRGLYLYHFEREPKEAGLNYWVGRVKDGMDFESIRNNFRQASECKVDCLNNSVDAKSKIRDMYQEILNRQPKEEGLNYWLAQYEKGLSLLEIKNHIQNSAEARIRGLYLYHLEREPKEPGLRYWVGRFQDGMDFESIRKSFQKVSECKVECLN